MVDNPYQPPTGMTGAESSSLQASQTAVDTSGARRKLLAPALGLIASGLVGGLIALWGNSRWYLFLYHQHATIATDQNAIYILVVGLINCGSCVIVVSGGIAMLRLRPQWAALAGASLACIPFFAPCFFLGIPFGIWAFIVLFNRDVKAVFHY